MTATTPMGRRPIRERDGDDEVCDSRTDAAAAAGAAVSPHPAIRRTALVALLALPWALFAYSTVSSLNGGGLGPGSGSRRPRSRSLAVYQSCSVSVLSRPDRPVVPVYGASYPGSGSATLHYLSEALTGLEAGTDTKDRADAYDKVLIRTHYPAWPKTVEGETRLMDRSILLIRNPLDALPGHASLYYEKKNGMAVNGEAPASEEYWLTWRDGHFDREIAKWSDHVEYWASKKPREKRLVVSYENLVDEKRGTVEAGRVASFLARGEGVEAVPSERVPCVWDRVVNYGREHQRQRSLKKEEEKEKSERATGAVARTGKKEEEDGGLAVSKARSLRAKVSDGPTYRYTEEQLWTVTRTLEKLKEKFPAEYALVVSLEEYRQDCKRRLRALEKKKTKSVVVKKDSSD